MSNSQLDVANLMFMYEQKVEPFPTESGSKTRLLRSKLLFEEVLEFIEAAGCFVGVNDNGDFEVFTDREAPVSLIGMYDAICDIGVVNDGAGNALGLHIEPGRAEVQRSNMSKKFPDGSIRKNEAGKVIKPDTYSPADLETVLNNQKAQKYPLIELLERNR